MGGSYGGYAALAGVTLTPKTFACAVDIVGPSNLITLLETIPPYWKPEIEQFTKRVGDFRTEAGESCSKNARRSNMRTGLSDLCSSAREQMIPESSRMSPTRSSKPCRPKGFL